MRVVRAPSAETIRYALVVGGPIAIGPFMALWLRSRGVDLTLIGPLVAGPLLVRLLLCRPLARWAAGCRTLWTPVAILCGVACLCSIICAGSTLVPLAVIAWWCVCLTANACIPLMDSTILDGAPDGQEGRALGRAKGAGALAYFLAVAGIGMLVRLSGPSAIPLWSGFMALLAGAFAASPMSASTRRGDRSMASPPAVLPRGRRWEEAPSPSAGRLLLILAGAALIEASHGLHAMAMLTWQDRGIGPEVGGLLWAIGPLADIAFFGLAGPLRERFGPVNMIAIGGVAAVVRWAGFAVTPSLAAMVVLQALHALSFSATYLGSVEAVHLMSLRSRTSRQITNWATATGLAGALGTLSSGTLYRTYGLEAYWLMAALAIAGLSVVVLAMIDRNRARPIRFKPVRQARTPPRGVTVSDYPACSEVVNALDGA